MTFSFSNESFQSQLLNRSSNTHFIHPFPILWPLYTTSEFGKRIYYYVSVLHFAGVAKIFSNYFIQFCNAFLCICWSNSQNSVSFSFLFYTVSDISLTYFICFPSLSNGGRWWVGVRWKKPWLLRWLVGD